MSSTTTYFGLEIVNKKLVREADIMQLPFADFWQESSVGSTTLDDAQTGERFVYLHDWERFSRLFIDTGRHRFMQVDSLQNA